jgi:FkbM family methyltransferase
MKNFAKLIYDLIPFKKQLFGLIRQFNIPKSLYQHLHFKGIFKVKVEKHYFRIEHFGYQIENELFWSGLTKGWEKISMQMWIDLCKNSNVIIDIGANTGVYSLVAKTVNPSSKVYGFEPVKRVFDKYQKNCTLNKFDIKCFDYAASNFDGEAIIYDTDSEHVYSVTVNKNLSPENILTVKTKIKTKKLSTFINENNITNIDLIKIDVETHEPEVLEGMEKFLYEYQPTLLIEILNDEVGEKVQSLLSGIDYLYFNIDEQNTPKRVDKITKSDYYNYLICKKEVAVTLKLI